jgi:hypothetical protein
MPHLLFKDENGRESSIRAICPRSPLRLGRHGYGDQSPERFLPKKLFTDLQCGRMSHLRRGRGSPSGGETDAGERTCQGGVGKDFLETPCRLQEGREINAGLHPHFRKQEDRVLRGRISRGPGGEGAAAETSQGRVEGPNPHPIGREGIGEAKPSGVMEMHSEGDIRKSLPAGTRDLFHETWVSEPDRIAEGDLPDTKVCGFFHGPQDGPDRDAALERTSEGGGKIDADLDPAGNKFLPNRFEGGEGFLRRLPDIVEVVGTADGEKEVEFLEAARRGGARPHEIGDEGSKRNPFESVHPGNHLADIAELGDCLRTDKPSDLDLPQAACGELPNQANLSVRLDKRRKILQAVPRPDLDNSDAIRAGHLIPHTGCCRDDNFPK